MGSLMVVKKAGKMAEWLVEHLADELAGELVECLVGRKEWTQVVY